MSMSKVRLLAFTLQAISICFVMFTAPWQGVAVIAGMYLTLDSVMLIGPVRRKLKDRRQEAIRTRAAARLFDWDDLGPTERTRIKLHNGLLTLNDARERVAEIKASEYGTPVVTPLQKSAPLA